MNPSSDAGPLIGTAAETQTQLAVAQILTARAAALAGCTNARRRLAALFSPTATTASTDPGADLGGFVEYGLLAGQSSEIHDDAPADGLVGGVGEFEGHPVVAAAYDTNVLGGTQSERNQRKLSKLIYLAQTNRWPVVLFIEGEGARRHDPRPVPPIVVYTRGRWDLYDGLAELSGWCPTIAIVTGPSLDGHAGAALLCDLVIGVSGASLGSEQGGHRHQRSVEELSARGDVDLVAPSEHDAIDAARRYLRFWFDDRPAKVGQASSDPTQSASHARIDSIVPDNRRRAYDMRKLLEAFADEASLLELGRAWAPSMITALARLGGAQHRHLRQPAPLPQRRRDRQRGRGQGRPFRGAVRRLRAAAGVLCRQSWLHGRPRRRTGRHRPPPRQAPVRPTPPPGSPLLGAGPQGLRAGPLRHVRLWLLSPGAGAALGLAQR